jgi:uncharacterized protein (DUF1330 family)
MTRRITQTLCNFVTLRLCGEESNLESPIIKWALKELKMIYITQLIYIKEGQEKVFHQFEDVAIPIIAKYNGRLLLRIRPGEDAFIEKNVDNPYEIHFVEFDSEQDFKNFMLDEERKKFLHLKEQSIKSSVLYKGVRL